MLFPAVLCHESGISIDNCSPGFNTQDFPSAGLTGVGPKAAPSTVTGHLLIILTRYFFVGHCEGPMGVQGGGTMGVHGGGPAGLGGPGGPGGVGGVGGVGGLGGVGGAGFCGHLIDEN